MKRRSEVSRRTFLALAATAAAGAATPAVAEGAATAPPRQEDTRRASPPVINGTTSTPPVLEPLDLKKHYTENITLECAELETKINGTPVRLHAYNGQIPGPIIVTKAGITLNVTVKNNLPETSSAGWDGDPDVPHHFTHTNLHLHGLDIAPHIFYPLATENASAPMIAIPPKGEFHYPFVIPGDQSPGLNWYHPHSHGSTAVQAVSGMAGALIIEGAIDEVPEIKAAKDYLLAVQDIGIFPIKPGDSTYGYMPEQNAIWQTFGGNVTKYDPGKGNIPQPQLSCGFTTGDYALRYYLVNGIPFFMEQHNQQSPQNPTPTQLDAPVIKVVPGEVVRLRLLNACSDLMMPVQVKGLPVYLLAMDGNNFNSPWEQPYQSNSPQMTLGPANRAEFLVKIPETATPEQQFPVLQLEQGQQFLQAVQKTIANLTVVASTKPVHMELPKRLPPVTRDPPITDKDITRRRRFVLSSTFPGVLNPYVGIDFLVNNQLYDEFAVPTVVALGDCEEWTIEVPSSEHGGTEGHPFHIHVNDFEVMSIAGIKPGRKLIMDTLWIQQNTASVIRMRFKEWTGKSVFHCHILPHEETGMMQNFLILKERPQHGATGDLQHHHGV